MKTVSPLETICMNRQILFSGKNKKNISNLLSAELAERVVKVKEQLMNNNIHEKRKTYFSGLYVLGSTETNNV